MIPHTKFEEATRHESQKLVTGDKGNQYGGCRSQNSPAKESSYFAAEGERRSEIIKGRNFNDLVSPKPPPPFFSQSKIKLKKKGGKRFQLGMEGVVGTVIFAPPTFN